MPHIFRTQFLYALVKEIDRSNTETSHAKVDTTLRIVHWRDDSDENGGYFIIYGNRPRSIITGPYNPYRVLCHTMEQVIRFTKTVISNDHDVAIELQQFDGLNDDSEDQFHIDWDNTAENGSTELVAFDFSPIKMIDGTNEIAFKPNLQKLLRILRHTDVV